MSSQNEHLFMIPVFCVALNCIQPIFAVVINFESIMQITPLIRKAPIHIEEMVFTSSLLTQIFITLPLQDAGILYAF